MFNIAQTVRNLRHAAIVMGIGIGRAGVIGRAFTSNAAVGNVGGGEDDLITYTMPANSLNIAKRGVRITCWGTGANNANVKTLKVYFGSQVILTTVLTASQVDTWRSVSEVFSTGASTQDWVSALTQAGTTSIIDNEIGTATQTDTSAIIIKATGSATADNDIVQEGMLVEFF